MQRSPDVSSTPVRSEAQCSAVAPCQVSLTGFREDDVWQEEKGKNGYSSGNDYDENASDGGGGSGNRSELEVYEQLAEQAGVAVQATLMSSTAVLVARRGFTAKRLLAARRRIPAVMPRWIADGCPRVAAAATSKPGLSEQMNLWGGAETVLVDAEYAVPWLHGYVFSTTGLTTQEKAAIEQICAKQHGAVIEAALTYRCDVLLTSAECIRELQELLRRDSLVSLSSNTAARKDQEKLCNAADVNITNISSSKVESWLTDKLRFALEFDIPVVDYVKLFALLRLDRLPSPATALHVSTSASRLEKKSKDVAEATAATAPWPREVEEALSGRDFDTVVQISRVAAPVGGASRWHALLERAAAAAAAAQKESHRTQEKEKEEDEEAEGKEGDAALNREGWYEEGGDQDRSPCTASTSSTSSSSSSSSSASTVSDPDAWEDFVQHMLVPHWADGRANDDNGHPNGYPNVLQRINAYPLQKGQPATKMEQQQQQPAPLTLNTVDVDVLQPTSSARADQTTLHVSTPDYYSGTAAAACSMEHFVNTDMCQDASPCHPPRLRSAVTLGASQVSPSPRLTTNALLQPDEPPHPSSETSTSPSTALARGDEFGERINAYYAAQRREQQQPSAHHMPISAAPWRVPSAAPSVSITSPKCLAAVGGSEAQHSDTLSTTTQVLVESCAAADESAAAADHSTKRNTAPPPTRKAATTTSLSARFVLPLWPMHPPYLSVCLLGCTAAEERQARVWCGVCRFLRTPVPTVETDVVLLGSRVLFRKRCTVSSANAAGSDSKKIGRGLRAPSRQRTCGGKGGSGTVTVRYWEMDAVVARVLSDTCGVALSRIAPLRWLEDAAAATQKAAAKEAAVSTAVVAEETKSEESDENFGRIQAEARKREVETTSTPQDTLADLVHDAVQQQRLKTQQQQQQRDPVMKSGDIGVDSTPSSSFHPFPILSTDELPSLASPAYYIRLRRAYAITSTSAAEKPAVSASAAAAAAAAMAPNMAASTASEANSVEMNAKSLAVVLPQQQKKATRGSNASESSAGSPFSPATSTTSKVDAGASPNAFTSNHNSDCISNGGSNPRLRISNSEVNTSTHYPLSPASSAGVSGASTFTREPPTPSDAEKKFAPGDPRQQQQQQQQQHAHDEELATASRRFNQLVGLFIVDKGDATTSLHTGKSEEGKARKADIVHSRRHVLESCSFCCVEGEYSRVDWAVLRGLIRYGGGRVEKKTAEEWVELLAKYKKKKKDRRPLLETTSTDFESSQEANGCDRPAQLHLAACVRRSIEFEKQQRKLTRLLQLLQPRHDSEHSDATTNNSDAMDEKKNVPHRLRAATLMDHTDDTIDAVAQLRRKLANTARACQLSPVLSLLPHSFQHAPAAVAEKGRSASSHASTKNSDVPDAVALSTINRMHPLHGLARITQDYILASLAVGYCLNPLSCFLFCTSIPSAPDMRLFHARTLQQQQQQPAPPTQQRMIAVDQKGRGNAAAAAAAQLCKPQLSAWMREKRYCKAESVGVCIAFLWRLPRSDSRWVDLVDVARGAPPSAPLVSKAPKTAKRRERYAAPSVQLVPLIRVLLLGLRNAVEAMGGHVADAYSPASATHVVVVDTEAILASSLTELYTADVPTDDTHVQPPPPQMATGADTEKEEEWERGKSGEADGSAWASHYWPAEDLTAMMRSAARHELSIVDVEWLASCVDWGIFIDEAGFPPPRNIHERIAAEQRRQQQAKRQPRSQTTKTLTQRVSNHHHLHQHPQQPHPCSPAPRLTPQSIRDGSAARHAEARKRCRTPSPTPPPLSSATADDDVDVPSWRQQTATAPDASRATAAPHTPPSPLSTKPAMVEDGMPCFVREEVAAPPQPFITPHTASLLQGGEGSFHGVGDGAADHRAHTPVMRRMRPPSTSNSNSNVQPCSTPPARPPMPASSFSSPHPVSLSSPWPSRAAPNSATPSRRSDSHSTPLRRAAATATAAAATGGVRQRSLSNSLQRRRTSLSASQHNTYSLAEQQDAEAYVEHLGSMFNFCSPGSTPLPSVRHAGEQRKQASSLPASRESGDNERTPLPDAFRDQLLSQMLSQRTSQVSENASNDVAASATQRAASSSSVLTTPRRRTLRAVAAAMSQATATSDTPPRSPERRRRRAERSSSAAALMPLHGSQTPDLHYHEEEEEEEGRAVERVLAANVCSEEDDATVPLPCGANTPDAAAQNQVTTPDVSYKMEVVPDSQPDACDANGHEDDRGAYASFANLGRGSPAHGVSTEKGEQSLDEGASNARPSLELIGDEPPPPQQQQQQLVLAADNDDAEEDGSCSSQPQRRGTADASFALTKEGLSAGAVADRGGKPRLGMCSAPRQTSPSPVPPHLRTAEDVVDVDADSENSTEKHNVQHPVHDTETDQRNSDRGGLPRHTHRRSHPSPAFSLWATHRPLSLSQRSSRSPVPPPPSPSASLVEPKSNSAAVAASTTQKPTTLAALREAGESFLPSCLRVYVVHDLPHRASRVQRCLAALHGFTHPYNSSVTSALLQQQTNNNNNDNKSNNDAENRVENEPKDAPSRAFARSTLSSSLSPPVCFVKRCEDADVCVTHEVNLRESVLVAIALGCWVVQPGFLECVAAIVESFCHNSIADHDTGLESCRRVGKDRPPTVAHVQELHLLPHPSAPSLSFRHSSPTAACYLRLCEMRPTYEWTAVTTAAPASPLHRSLVLQCRRRRQAVSPARHARLQHENHDGNVGGQARHIAVFDRRSFLLLYASPERPNDVPSVRNTAADARVHAIRRLLTAGGGAVLSVVQVGCTQAETARSQRIFPALSCMAEVPVLDNDSKCCLRRCANESQRPVKSLAARLQPKTQLTDEELYHDLVCLLCDAVFRTHRSAKSASRAHSTNPGLPVQRVGSSHSNSNSDCSPHAARQHYMGSEREAANTLTILLDTSLFEKRSATPEIDENDGCGQGCGVVLTRKLGEASASELSADQPKKLEQTRDVVPGRAASSPFSPGTWLVGWLFPCDMETGHDDEAESAFYPSVERHALQMHLCACCSLAHDLAKLDSVGSAAFVPAGQDGEGSTAWTVTSIAEAKWSYQVKDIPFQVPTFDEVALMLAAQEKGKREKELDATLHLATVARLWQFEVDQFRHRVEFRCTSWAGACVAAGGAAVLSTTSADTEVVARCPSGVAERDTWMQTCDAQTLLAVLPYA